MSTTQQNVCVPCRVAMVPQQNSVTLLTMDRLNCPCEAYEADLWICPLCGHQILTGVARTPYWHCMLEPLPPDHDDVYESWPTRSDRLRAGAME